MKRLFPVYLLFMLMALGCAHGQAGNISGQPSPHHTDALSPSAGQTGFVQTGTAAAPSDRTAFGTGKAVELAAAGEIEETDDDAANEGDEALEDYEEQQAITIADPLEGFNRAMFQFNDKLYFWVLKPVAEGYKKAVPETPRVSINNFFTNLGFPIRFVNFLLQADFGGAAAELSRFAVNTIWGIGGLMDPASSKQLAIPKKDPDFGQTLGLYGVGQGFYIVWPFFGPSSARDSVQLVGDYFLYPVYYLDPWYARTGVKTYEEVNDTSLKIGDYESLKEASIDPYIALRDAYAQYRQKKIDAAKGQAEPARPGGVMVGHSAFPYFGTLQELVIQERRNDEEKN